MIEKYDPDSFHHHSNPLVRFVERRRVKAIYKIMDVRQQNEVLEIGCGAGNVLQESTGGRLFGMDLSLAMVKKAKQKLNRTGFFFQGDAQHLPCKDHTFDQVICSEVLEHLLDPQAALEEMGRILISHGSAIISVPNELWINRVKKVLIQVGLFHWFTSRSGDYRHMPERMDDEWHIHSFRLDEWLHIFKKYFTVAHCKSIPFWWLPLRFVVRLERGE
jgi:ubiquinone/menaquinone biosynthesis C-methylase UbiE